MELLALFAEARQEAIVAAVRSQKEWPPAWTTDVHAAYAVLGKHPLGRDIHVANHFDFLHFFSTPEADAVLERGLQRFGDSALLHQRLRNRILERQDSNALEAEYARRLSLPSPPATLPWFAGYASLVAAEAHRRKNDGPAALAAYQRGIDLFLRYGTDTGNTDGAHYVAMGHAGVARVKLLAGDLASAMAALQQAFAVSPMAGAAVDGLGSTAVQTAQMLRQKASEAKAEDLVKQVDAALQALPAEALVPPEYERNPPGNRPQRRRRQ
jgi:tetratricopeptide (TPR) repeat protein